MSPTCKRPNAGGTLVYFRDGDPARVGNDHLITKHPAAQTGGTEIPVVDCAGEDLRALGEIGKIHLTQLRSQGGSRKCCRSGKSSGVLPG